MNHCQSVRALMTLYLDEELPDCDRGAVEAHLRDCKACRTLFVNEQQFLATIRSARPLYVARPALRMQVESMLDAAPPSYATPSALRQRGERSLRLSLHAINIIKRRWVIPAAAAVVLIVLAGVWSVIIHKSSVPRAPSLDFALMAVQTHQRHLNGQLPLEIITNMPERISAWFAGKVRFRVELPHYQALEEQTKLYDITGARLVWYNNDSAAYVAYQMRQRLVSLIITSAASAQPAGEDVIVSQGITFHYASMNGWKVLTWSDRGLTYALVSDLEERGQQSCLVCHQGTKDQDFLQRLR